MSIVKGYKVADRARLMCVARYPSIFEANINALNIRGSRLAWTVRGVCGATPPGSGRPLRFPDSCGKRSNAL